MCSNHCEGTHTRLADDLLDALIGYPLSKRQYKVVLAVIRKTYGYGKPEDDLNSSQLAGMTGLADSHCRAAVRELASLGVLRVKPGRCGQWLGINPDPSAWAYPRGAD
jgi:phage replication O-like protein O